MARFTRMQVLNTIYDISVVPVFYHADFDTARHVVSAIARGGCPLVEFVNRGDHAWEIFSELERYFATEDPSLIIGAGSIIDPYTAALYVNNGANFIVGPTCSDEVARFCNRRKIPYAPGCGSVTEVSNAESLGCEIIKIFPGQEIGGPAFVKSILGPMPWVSIMPTGGVDATRESISAWINSGVVALGMGSNLITKAMLASGDWHGIEQKVHDTLALVKEAKLRRG